MRRRTVVLALSVVGIEVWLYTQYAAPGAQFHFWLHGLFGFALGFLALAVYRIVVGTPVTPWGPGILGHVYSAFPDVLFLSFGILHVLWMDAFALHISVHFIPAPLVTMLVVFAVALAAERAAAHGRRRLASAGVAASTLIVATGLALRSPLPDTLQDVRSHEGIALLCPLAHEPAAPGPGSPAAR